MDNTLRSKRYKLIMNSPDYREKLEKLTKDIKISAKNSLNETHLAQEFSYHLKKFLSDELGIDNINLDPEVNDKILGHKFTGRMDAVSNSLIFEYKHPSKLLTKNDKEKAHNQVVDYLEQLFELEGKQYRAILTDGIKIKYYYYVDNIIRWTNFSDIDSDDIAVIVKSIINFDNKKFLPENIVKDFSLNSENSTTAELANELFKSLNGVNIDENTSVIFEEWKVLFNLSENDNGKSDDINKRRRELGKLFQVKIEENDTDFKSLYALQTTYAIIVKLIAAKILTYKQYGKGLVYFEDLSTLNNAELRDFTNKLENGLDFQNEGYINLLEGDFFSWYVFENQWNDGIAKAIKKVIKIIEGYSYITFKDEYEPIDIFKDLYMEVMPNAVRHSLGEYFTPSWLTDRVITESIKEVNKEKWRAIDPCCGTGVFLMTSIKKIIGQYKLSDLDKDKKNKLINEITERVIGIDMNPISVLTSRVSYFLSVMPLITEETSMEIPVYLGNSAIIGEKVNLDGVECYSVVTGSINGFFNTILPVNLVDNGNFLTKMSSLNKYLRVVDKEKWVKKFLENVSQKDKNDKVVEEIENLADNLYDLQEKNSNNTWLRIIANQLLISSIKNIDIIVGNPPWVKWEHLPQTYAQTIKKQCVDRHLFSGQTYMGAISLNICALISNVTAGKWLTKDGILTFLMPKTLLTQDSYAGFRNFYIDYENNIRMYLQKIEDWSKAGDPFIYTNEKFATYYYKFDFKDYENDGIPVTYINKKRNKKIQFINKHHNFSEVQMYFDIKKGAAFQLDKTRTGLSIFEGSSSDVKSFKNIIGQCDYKARSGVEFTPYEIYTLEAFNVSKDKKYCRFKNFSSTSTIHKASNTAVNGTRLETKYMKPLVKGSTIEPFNINFENEYGIFPYDSETTNLIEIDELEKNSPKLLNYLLDYQAIIGKQSDRSKMIARGKEFYSLSKIGKYTFAENLVTFRDNSKMAAAVVKPVLTHWGKEILPICAKHAPYISMDKKGNFITEDEAHYISGILNTKIVVDYFKFTYSSRSYSINFNIKIPKYNPENEKHIALSGLAMKAHSEEGKLVLGALKEEMNQLYLEICNESV
ncbi:Eco57I restriction-modification methylase domain-containing protein [Virgibacillus salinus]|uniref:site-specific DNA-methyltransferase (adenine-specific) n=1 Tax=Virgibacillus salinus TaxID=553311 RepID=A0A1H0XUV8_9BACI|nr:type I restriction-modification system subunit M [Virgibacillus salinus]SDQ06591.1 hypothetical protein SAMN05216231_0219 [Virgibacillus salinus]